MTPLESVISAALQKAPIILLVTGKYLALWH